MKLSLLLHKEREAQKEYEGLESSRPSKPFPRVPQLSEHSQRFSEDIIPEQRRFQLTITKSNIRRNSGHIQGLM